MAALDDLVVDAIEADVFDGDIIEAAMAEALRQNGESDRTGADRARDVAREIAAIDREWNG